MKGYIRVHVYGSYSVVSSLNYKNAIIFDRNSKKNF